MFIVGPVLGDHLILFPCVRVHARVGMNVSKSIWSCVSLAGFVGTSSGPEVSGARGLSFPLQLHNVP